MAGKSISLDYWRKFFRSANSDIFEVIEQAIVVAAADCPKEFKSRRDRIAEQLFTCKLSRCFGCNNVELQIADEGEVFGEEEGGGSVKREVGEKGSKMDSCNGEPEDLNRGGLSNYSYDEAEALTDVMEEESQIVGEVLRIKEVLYNKLDESDAVLYESLRRLELMQLSVETLKATEIGRAVNDLRKHNCKQIRNLVRTLIVGWKVLVDEWVNATAAITDHSPDSVNPSMVYEEEGLPSPPLDEGALLLATQPTSIQLSEFFDGMDDDGNFRSSGDMDNVRDARRPVPQYRGPVRRQEPPRQLAGPVEKTQVSKQEIVVRQARPNAIPSAQSKPQAIVNKLSKPSTADSGPGRPLKNPSPVQKPNTQFSSVQRKLSNGPQDNSEEASVDAKFEQAKRMLHERYQQVENAKRQRTIQVMEIHDIPKQPLNQRPSNMKPKNQFRNWANSRR